MIKIEAVIFDWAGTTVDYGCFAPLNAFISVFHSRGIMITTKEAREPMGMLKRDHMSAILHMERVQQLWMDQFSRKPVEQDIDDLYADFEPMLLSGLANHCEPIPGVLKLIKRLRDQGIKIGSTTGYTAKMMEIVTATARSLGYTPDYLVTPDDVPAGRPYPWMCYKNAIGLGAYPMAAIVKVGDTISDIKEGVNAGAWSVGVVKGGSELGFTQEEVESCDPEDLRAACENVRDAFMQAGAHYVIDRIDELEGVIEAIDLRLQKGESPYATR